ncbi:nuclear transport factor 2 family protein [Flavobacterium piscisymbiosum]|uniref:Nuclear transport factor 2 family protein n=1 Tax=Flavobacterium piscisymbiosum TaxID=2893753 RepID=A0ABS8MJD6_9FLAO|nr:nuclear transport factor 2 family protein [Flavobacterium sp. F-30]MCC9065612.1 nuclear transport factor 2 family protein [Flavobacterium sp. F-30]
METQIIELEKKYWQGMENHDYLMVKKLTHFPCIIASKNGVQSVDEAKFRKMFESGDGDKIKVVNFSNVESQLVGENTAVLGYIIELAIAGDKQKAAIKCACTSTWIKENSSWVCALHTEAELVHQ